MSNPERIREMLRLIEEVWVEYPDLRFMQLIYNLQSSYSNKNDGIGEIEITEHDNFIKTVYDLFNTEDDQFIDFLSQVSKSGF